MSKSQWFTISVTPRTDLRAWYRGDDGATFPSDQTAVMLVQHRYPVANDGHRIPGSDWLDSRVVFADVDSTGWVAELSGNFAYLLPVGEQPEDAAEDIAKGVAADQ